MRHLLEGTPAEGSWEGVGPGVALRPQVGFKPWQAPTKPPPGFYDPGLDAAGRASQRGLDYLTGDTEDSLARNKDEYGFSLGDLERNKGRSLADILRARTLYDANAAQAGQREAQDYGRATGDLSTQYTRLGVQQTGNAESAGVAGGGTLAAALRARTANHEHDQGGLDQTHARFVEDQANQLQHAHEAFDLAASRVGEDYGSVGGGGAEGSLTRHYQYGVDDAGKAVERAGIENQFYQGDIGDQRWFQAQQAGYVSPQRGQPGGIPANEFQDANGHSYRIVVRGSRRYRVTPDGRETFVGTRPRGK